MTQSTEQTASFVLRFTQKIYEAESGEPEVQWRGKITHVQDNDDANFSEMKDAIEFMQGKLSALTLSSVDDRTEEEKEGILQKSLDIWQRLSRSYPKMVVDAIKDPKAQVNQIQEQISSKAEEISSKLDFQSLRPTSKTDHQNLMEEIDMLKSMMERIHNKMEVIDSKLDS